jgi:hypothetical protein
MEKSGACGSMVGRGTMLPAWRSRARFKIRPLDFLSVPNLSVCSMGPGWTQLLTEVNTRNLSLGRMVKGGQHVRPTKSYVGQLSRNCGNLGVSLLYGHLSPVTDTLSFLERQVYAKGLKNGHLHVLSPAGPLFIKSCRWSKRIDWNVLKGTGPCYALVWSEMHVGVRGVRIMNVLNWQ